MKEEQKRKVLLTRILSGKVKCEIGNNIFYVGIPTPIQQFEAEEIYNERLRDGELLGMMTEVEMLDYLQDHNLWDLDDQRFLDELPVKLENMKVQLYTFYSNFKSKRVEQLRRSIHRLLDESYKKFTRRHAYDIYTCEGFALSCKLQYLVCATVTDLNGLPIDISYDSNLVQQITQMYLNTHASENEIRDLARNDPWRSIWIAGKAEGMVFGVPSILLTDEQRQLLSWSKLYDNVRESPEIPDDVVINDDDLMDGWLILQNRKADKEKRKQDAPGVSSRMSNATEIFIPAETPEDAYRINQMNDAQARMIKRQKLQMAHTRGNVPEQDMPEAQLQLRQKALQQIRDRASKTRK